MTMLSSAGLNSPQRRSALWLAAVALAVLAVSLGLAFAFASAPRPAANGDGARRTSVETPIVAPAAQPAAVSTAAGADAEHVNDVRGAAGSGPLWAVLAPWAFAIDGIAVLGLAAVLIVRNNARRRRGARR